MEEIVKEVDQVTNGTGINLLINNSGLFLRECKGIMDVTRHDILTHMETNTIAPIMIIQVSSLILTSDFLKYLSYVM